MEKIKAAGALAVHHQQQYLDRCLYWSLRWASRAAQDVLCIIIDSPDKTKYAWPCFPYHRLPKDLAGYVRPRVILTGVIAHGYCTTLFYADENRSHGANAFLEVLLRTISRVQRLCKEGGRAFPRHLVLQSDNTVAQAKNALTLLLLGVLVSLGFFSTATLNFLMVGHTHEDIDQLFALLIQYILRVRSWQTPGELVGSLVSSLSPQFQARGETLTAELLGSVRDFQHWLLPLETQCYNCLANRGGVEAPHSFTFKSAQDLTPTERSTKDELESWRPNELHPLDVVCCVKTYMRDQHLQQSPVLVVPVDRLQRLTTAQPNSTVPIKAWTDQALENFLSLADLCTHEHNMPEAGAALVALCSQRLHVPAADPWPTALIDRAIRPEPTKNPYFPHLPASSFRLLVRRS